MEFKISIDETEEVLSQVMARFSLYVQREVKLRTPVRTGIARNSVVVDKVDDLQWFVGTNLSYWKQIEDGMEPMVIKPRNKKALYWRGARHPVKKVNHPGYEGRKIFRGVLNDKTLLNDLMEKALR